MAEVPRGDISPEDLDRIRQVAWDYLCENFEGPPSSMKVILTTHHASRTAIEAGPGAPELPPDDRPLYLAVFEGRFRARDYGRRGCWLAISVTPAFRVLGYRLAPPQAQRIVNLDLNELGQVHHIAL